MVEHTLDVRFTLRSALSAATERLTVQGVDSARLNAERLFCHVLGFNRTDLFLNRDHVITGTESDRIGSLIERRISGEPLQYILGETEFMSLPFVVTPDVLIPRPETEILVEAVLSAVGTDSRPVRILDLGTGSGCIAVSLAKYSNARITAIDQSESALKIAVSNAEKNVVTDRICFIHGDICDPKWMADPFDIIVSNPPYVTLNEWPGLPLEVRGFEPRSALCDEGDGLSFYRLISSMSDGLLCSDGMLFFETGDKQAEAVRNILRDGGFENLRIIPDYNGIGRVVQGIWKPSIQQSGGLK
jgi:release factor glutamine methyltransferase